jgi:hypothetical protein
MPNRRLSVIAFRAAPQRAQPDRLRRKPGARRCVLGRDYRVVRRADRPIGSAVLSAWPDGLRSTIWAAESHRGAVGFARQASLCVDMVLVHGTTQSPSGWDRLVHELERLGHRCATVDLAAIDGDRKSAGFAEDVAGQVDVRSPMVVAHSGSGLLLGAICDALDASRQVFLAALIPDSIHSLMDEVQQRSGEMSHTDWLGVDPVADPTSLGVSCSTIATSRLLRGR